MINKKNIIKLLSILLGSFYIIYYIYRRLRTRNEIDIINNILTYNIALIIIILIILILVISNIILKISLGKISNNIIIIYLNQLYEKLYEMPLKALHEYLLNNFNIYGQIEYYLCELLEFIYKHKLQYIFLTLFVILPKITVLSVFILELYFTGKIYYTLYSLILLILSKLIKLFVFLIGDFLSNNYDILKDYADISWKLDSEKVKNKEKFEEEDYFTFLGENYNYINTFVFKFKGVSEGKAGTLNSRTIDQFEEFITSIGIKMPLYYNLSLLTAKINKYLLLLNLSIVLIILISSCLLITNIF